MFKRIAIIISISISAVITTLLSRTHFASQDMPFTLTIESINSTFIFAHLTENRVYIRPQDTPIYDSNGNMLNFSDIKVGDNVFIYTNENSPIKNTLVKRIDDENKTFTVEVLNDHVLFVISLEEAENAEIIDSHGNKINSSDLREEDCIRAVYKQNNVGDKDLNLVKIEVLNENIK